jgi:hypothetical protein
MHTAPDERH